MYIEIYFINNISRSDGDGKGDELESAHKGGENVNTPLTIYQQYKSYTTLFQRRIISINYIL